MTTPERSSLVEAAEADVVEQRRPIDDAGDDTWLDVQRISEGRDWQASEGDLVEQAAAVPVDESE